MLFIRHSYHSHLTYQLDEIVNVITKMLESDFLSILLERIDSVGAAPDLSGTDAESKEEELAVLSERLQPLLQGLVQQNRTDILGVYWTQLETRLRSIIKDTVLGFLAEQSEKVGGAGAHPAAANGGGVSVGATTGSKTSQQLASWGDALRELNFDVWMALLDCIFARLLAVLQVQVESRDAVAKLLRALQTEMGGVDPGPPPVAGGSGGTTAKSTAVSAALRPSSPRKFVSVAESASESQLTSPTELSPHHHSEGNGSAALDAANVGDVNDALLMEGLRESDPAHLDADVGDVDLRELDEAPTSDRTDAGVASPTANSTASSAGAGSSKQRGTAAAATTTTATGTASTNQGRGAAAEGGARVQWSRIYADNNAVVERALEEVHQRCSKLIQARSRDGADTGLAASSFIVYFQKAHAFVRASETLCNASNALLRGTLLQQAKAFLDQFHTRQCEKLRMILNNEQWVPVGNCVKKKKNQRRDSFLMFFVLPSRPKSRVSAS